MKEIPEGLQQKLHDKLSAERAVDLENTIRRHNQATTKLVQGIPKALECWQRGFLVVGEKCKWSNKTDEEYFEDCILQFAQDITAYWKSIRVEPEQLPELHAMRGKFKLSDSPSEIVDDAKGLVKLVFEFEDKQEGWPTFYMVKPLPPGSKCRIVKEITSNVSTSLVCDVPNSNE